MYISRAACVPQVERGGRKLLGLDDNLTVHMVSSIIRNLIRLQRDTFNVILCNVVVPQGALERIKNNHPVLTGSRNNAIFKAFRPTGDTVWL